MTREEKGTTSLRMEWQLEMANRNTFFMSSASHNRRLSCKPSRRPAPHLVMSMHRQGWEAWKIVPAPDGSVRFQSREHGLFLDCNELNELAVSPLEDGAEKWYVEAVTPGSSGSCARGGYNIFGYERQVQLACDKDGRLYTTRNDDGDVNDDDKTKDEQDTIWFLEPCMPPTIGNKHLGVIAAVGATTAIVAIAMPFAIMGVVGAFGAEATVATGVAVAAAEVGEAVAVVEVGLTAVATGAAVGGGALIGAAASSAAVAGTGGFECGRGGDRSTANETATVLWG